MSFIFIYMKMFIGKRRQWHMQVLSHIFSLRFSLSDPISQMISVSGTRSHRHSYCVAWSIGDPRKEKRGPWSECYSPASHLITQLYTYSNLKEILSQWCSYNQVFGRWQKAEGSIVEQGKYALTQVQDYRTDYLGEQVWGTIFFLLVLKCCLALLPFWDGV